MRENDFPNNLPAKSRRRDGVLAAMVAAGFPAGNQPEASGVEASGANPLEEKFRAMQAQMKGVLAAVKQSNADSPFASIVMACPLPPKFKMPSVESFDGSQDLLDHLETYKTLMHIHAYPGEILCRVFPATLKGPARLWFSKIKAGTIFNFTQFSKLFVGHFIGRQRQRRPVTHLLTIKQSKEESLRDYVGRFNKEVLKVDEADEKMVITAFMSGLKTPRFMASLVKKLLIDMAKLRIRAQKYINVEDAMKACRDVDPPGSSKPKKKRQERADQTRDNRDNKARRFNNRPDRGLVRFDQAERFTPLNTRLENILYKIQNDPGLKWPGQMRAPAEARLRAKYCHFHRDHGHDTNECFDLKRQVEALIQRDRLDRFVAARDKNKSAG